MQLDKWIEGVDPATSPAEAARLSLEQRLKAGWLLLPLAAHHAKDDVEHVHHLRVATFPAVLSSSRSSVGLVVAHGQRIASNEA